MMASKKEAEANAKILSYMEKQNRPYSVNDVFMNLHKEIGKTAVQKSLDALVLVSIMPVLCIIVFFINVFFFRMEASKKKFMANKKYMWQIKINFLLLMN